MAHQRKNILIEIDRELHAKLREAAAERVIGLRLLVDMLLRDGLDRLVPVDELRQRRTDA